METVCVGVEGKEPWPLSMWSDLQAQLTEQGHCSIAIRPLHKSISTSITDTPNYHWIQKYRPNRPYIAKGESSWNRVTCPSPWPPLQTSDAFQTIAIAKNRRSSSNSCALHKASPISSLFLFTAGPPCQAAPRPSACRPSRRCGCTIPSASPKTRASPSCPASWVCLQDDALKSGFDWKVVSNANPIAQWQRAGLQQATTPPAAPLSRTSCGNAWTGLRLRRRLRTRSTTTWAGCRNTLRARGSRVRSKVGGFLSLEGGFTLNELNGTIALRFCQRRVMRFEWRIGGKEGKNHENEEGRISRREREECWCSGKYTWRNTWKKDKRFDDTSKRRGKRRRGRLFTGVGWRYQKENVQQIWKTRGLYKRGAIEALRPFGRRGSVMYE